MDLVGDNVVACKPSPISAGSSTADVSARNARVADVRRVGSFIRMLGVPAYLPHEVGVFVTRFEDMYPALTRVPLVPGNATGDERQSHVHPHAIKSYSTDPPSRLRQDEAR